MNTEFIAELGWNHMGDMVLAKEMVSAAKESGADYAKFQTWSVNRLKDGPWNYDGRREIYEKAELTEEKHEILKDYCDSKKIKFLTSCFCPKDLGTIRKFTDSIKIPSTECSNAEIVSQSLDLFNNVFMSIGAHSQTEYSKWFKFEKITFLHCVSSYPCNYEKANMLKIKVLQSIVGNNRVGYSGHCIGINDAIEAICMDCTIIEKHFTIDNNLPGRDNKFAILPHQLKTITDFYKDHVNMTSSYQMDYLECEKDIRDNYRGRWNNE
jgi:sialic acid synthase SpsE